MTTTRGRTTVGSSVWGMEVLALKLLVLALGEQVRVAGL